MKSPTTLIFFGLTLVAIKAQRFFDETGISPRIMNGVEAKRTQFPYIASLQIYVPDNQVLQCGGSIISQNFIVSAAHCFQNIEIGLDVILGAWSLFNLPEKEQEIIFVPQINVIIHEDWDIEVMRNDIALVKMPRPIGFNEYIQKISLPQIQKSKPYPNFVGDYAIAAGWGHLNDDGDFSDILLWVKVPIIENNVCKAIYPEVIQDANICVNTTGGFSTCAGDSGGPLVLAGTNPVLIGLTSFGNPACGAGVPAVFTRITSYLDWIKNHTDVQIS